MPEHQILTGVALRPWDAADSPGCYDYEIDFCAAGSRVYPLGAECAVIRPEQIMLFQRKQLTAVPCGLTGRESGFSLLLDSHCAEMPLSNGQSPGDALQALCAESGCVCLHSPQTAAICSALMQPVQNEELTRLRIMELLLLLLDCPEREPNAPARCMLRETEIARAAFETAMTQKHARITIDALAARVHTSPTYLKLCFRRTYGTSLYAYIRAEKMQRAAAEIAASERRVIDIAADYGYDNSSKFAAAFRKVIGMTPRGYRKNSNVRMEHLQAVR